MELHFFIFLFFTGTVHLVWSIPRKYYLINQAKTWSSAQAFCRLNHTDLATIEGSGDLLKLQAEAQKHQFSSSAWIGLYKHFHDWRWSLGNLSFASQIKWCTGDPNNYNGVEECGVLSIGPCVGDIQCIFPCPYICFDDRNSGSDRYIYYANATSWYGAQTFCRLYHTDLTSARDTTEIIALQGLVSGWTWFGLSRNSWSWSDQTNTTTIMWAPGNPSSMGMGSYCGYIYDNKQVYDAACSNLNSFFCYSVITGQKQIIRMKVQSNQDVNDPALMTVILNQTLQKLKVHGLENITVKWRQQPNEKFFHKMN